MTNLSYNKEEIKEQITINDIFDLLNEWGGEPFFQNEELIISKTICHNHPNEESSRKLYYYNNSKLFQCWTECGGFDIFELVIKIMNIQYHKQFDLNDAVRWIAYKLGISSSNIEVEEQLEDWDIFNKYNNIEDINTLAPIKLNIYDDKILNNFNYSVKLTPWLKEGISQGVLDYNHIGFYPGDCQITIPHYDADNNLIGIRGRALAQEDVETKGKYRPLKINGILYNHPLAMNLYNLNNSKNNIKAIEKAIIFESEKSTLMYQSYFGIENDISVACCGSNISLYQINSLIQNGAKEIIIAFDKQFQEKNDKEFNLWIKKLYNINNKYKNLALISFIFDTGNLLGYKDSPIDRGPEIFKQLYKKRIII